MTFGASRGTQRSDRFPSQTTAVPSHMLRLRGPRLPVARTFTVLIALLGGAHLALHAQADFHGCPITGDAGSGTIEALNVLKNRDGSPVPADIDSNVTLAALLARGDDRRRWDDRRAATIVGYASDVKPGSVESVNCHAKDSADRDTHIELILDPLQNSGPDRVIVEVTPRLRAEKAGQGEDWSTRALRRDLLGRWVRVTGWLMFDTQHAHQSANTAPGRPNNWRATAWELHPVTAIQVVSAPR